MDVLFDNEGFPLGEGIRVGFKYSGGVLRGADDVAQHFGLTRLGADWVTLSEDEARLVLQCMLRFQFAHGSERVSAERAAGLASQFVARCPPGSQFFTNWRWHDRDTFDPQLPKTLPPQFTSATRATFDGGLVVYSDRVSAVFWIEDED